MSHVSFLMCRPAGNRIAFSAVVCVAFAGARAPAIAAENGTVPGRIDFEDADLPPASVEIDLSEGMFGDLFGLGEAAITGVADTLRQSAVEGSGSEGTRIAAEQLAAARQIVELVREVVREARVRVYERGPEGLSTQFDRQLDAEQWETIVRVRKGTENARISIVRETGAIRGVFVVATNGREAVLANVVCDISPENVKKLTSAAARIGLENGLQQALDKAMPKLRHRLPSQGSIEVDPIDHPTAPTPPTPPKAVEPAQPESE